MESNVMELAALVKQQKEHRPSKLRTKDRAGSASMRLARVATPR